MKTPALKNQNRANVASTQTHTPTAAPAYASQGSGDNKLRFEPGLRQCVSVVRDPNGGYEWGNSMKSQFIRSTRSILIRHLLSLVLISLVAAVPVQIVRASDECVRAQQYCSSGSVYCDTYRHKFNDEKLMCPGVNAPGETTASTSSASALPPAPGATTLATPAVTKDAKGCAVVNSRPIPDKLETIKWSGKCERGLAQGNGVLEWFANAILTSQIEGQFRDGKILDGHAVKRFFVDGKLYSTSDGEFKDEKLYGRGTIVRADGMRAEGEFQNDSLHNSLHGTVNSPNGTLETGDFINGKHIGQGTCTYPDGTKYVGAFQGGKFNGQGSLVSPDGAHYEGGFIDNHFSGQGKAIFPNGNIYFGEWRLGKPNGQGTFIYTNGLRAVGEFVDGKTDAVLTNANGVVASNQISSNVPDIPQATGPSGLDVVATLLGAAVQGAQQGLAIRNQTRALNAQAIAAQQAAIAQQQQANAQAAQLAASRQAAVNSAARVNYASNAPTTARNSPTAQATNATSNTSPTPQASDLGITQNYVGICDGGVANAHYQITNQSYHNASVSVQFSFQTGGVPYQFTATQNVAGRSAPNFTQQISCGESAQQGDFGNSTITQWQFY